MPGRSSCTDADRVGYLYRDCSICIVTPEGVSKRERPDAAKAVFLYPKNMKPRAAATVGADLYLTEYGVKEVLRV